jgi:hypothetical protein
MNKYKTKRHLRSECIWLIILFITDLLLLEHTEHIQLHALSPSPLGKDPPLKYQFDSRLGGPQKWCGCS